MTDTQWPRFEVFHQESSEEPHRHAGSVHAPDAEIALLNARDVFVRRPECSSLWVAPALAVESATAEQLEGLRAEPSASGKPVEFLVFAKDEPRGELTHVGRVVAPSARAALQQAAHGGGRLFVLWVVPAGQITRSEPEQASSLFAPAHDKPFRDQAYYHVQTALRRLRREAGR